MGAALHEEAGGKGDEAGDEGQHSHRGSDAGFAKAEQALAEVDEAKLHEGDVVVVAGGHHAGEEEVAYDGRPLAAANEVEKGHGTVARLRVIWDGV